MWFRVICLSVVCLAAPRESTTFWPLWWRVPVVDKSTDNAKPHSICFFTTVATNLAIWLANLPLSIRVQTGLHTSMCHVMPFFSSRSTSRSENKHFLWPWYCGKFLILPQYQRQRKCFFFRARGRARAEKGITWHIDVCSPVSALIDNSKLTNQIARLVAIVVKITLALIATIHRQ